MGTVFTVTECWSRLSSIDSTGGYQTRILKKLTSGAFTLIEILVVVILLGILAAIIVPQFMSSSDEAKLSALKSDLHTLRAQIQLYRVKTGAYPGADLSDLVDDYLPKLPTNPFNNLATVGLVANAATVGWVYVDGAIYPGGDNPVVGGVTVVLSTL